MVDKWILKTLRNGSGEALKLFLRKRQSRDDLILNGLVHKAADHFVLHTVTDNILAG